MVPQARQKNGKSPNEYKIGIHSVEALHSVSIIIAEAEPRNFQEIALIPVCLPAWRWARRGEWAERHRSFTEDLRWTSEIYELSNTIAITWLQQQCAATIRHATQKPHTHTYVYYYYSLCHPMSRETVMHARHWWRCERLLHPAPIPIFIERFHAALKVARFSSLSLDYIILVVTLSSG